MDVYAQLAADRDLHAASCARLVNEGLWDLAAVEGKLYAQHASTCLAVVTGTSPLTQVSLPYGEPPHRHTATPGTADQ